MFLISPVVQPNLCTVYAWGFLVCFVFVKSESFLLLEHQNAEVKCSVTSSETTKVMGLQREEEMSKDWTSRGPRLCSQEVAKVVQHFAKGFNEKSVGA